MGLVKVSVYYWGLRAGWPGTQSALCITTALNWSNIDFAHKHRTIWDFTGKRPLLNSVISAFAYRQVAFRFCLNCFISYPQDILLGQLRFLCLTIQWWHPSSLSAGSTSHTHSFLTYLFENEFLQHRYSEIFQDREDSSIQSMTGATV